MSRRWTATFKRVVAASCAALAVAMYAGGSADVRMPPAPNRVPAGQTGAPDTRPAPPFSFGLFAGYLWTDHGPVRSVQASWTVPGIIGGPQLSLAATWIGAQARTCPLTAGTAAVRSPSEVSAASMRDLLRVPFIQLGTIERRYMSLTGPVDRYFAFWSDTSLHFAAQIMFPVQAGDRVTARLTLAGGRWIASMTDLNSHHSSAVTTADETSSVLDLAEWVQEDPAAALGSGRPYPYPDLSPIRVHDLEVNSSEPRDADVNSVWMDRGNTYLAPGPLSDAGFALRRATLTPAGRRYLRIVAAEKAAVGTFAQRLAGWTAATHISQIASERKVLADVLHATVKALASATWPLATRASVRALVAQTRALETRTRSGPTLSRGGITAWRTAWLFEAHFADTAALAARRALRLPQGMPAGCRP